MKLVVAVLLMTLALAPLSEAWFIKKLPKIPKIKIPKIKIPKLPRPHGSIWKKLLTERILKNAINTAWTVYGMSSGECCCKIFVFLRIKKQKSRK